MVVGMHLFFVLYNTEGKLTSYKFTTMVIGCLMFVHAAFNGAVRCQDYSDGGE